MPPLSYKMQRLKNLIIGERKLYAVYVVSRWLFEQCFGRLHALLLGWPSSFLGHGSRVLGSRFISFSGRAHIKRYAWIEAEHVFNGCFFNPHIFVGRGFGASDRLHLSCINEIRIGEFCLFGSGVYIADHNHGIYSGLNQSDPHDSPIARQLFSTGPVIIGSNVWLGDNVVIVGPVRIGDGAVVGANSVVTSDIPENVIAAGAPAKIIKSFDQITGEWLANVNAN